MYKKHTLKFKVKQINKATANLTQSLTVSNLSNIIRQERHWIGGVRVIDLSYHTFDFIVRKS